MATQSKGKTKRRLGEDLTQSEVSEAIGYSTRQIQNWLKAGLPSAGEGHGRRFQLPTVVRWLIEFKLRDTAKGKLEVAQTRRAQAEAERAELRLRRERGELVPVADFEGEVNHIVGTLSAGLKAAPSRWGSQLVGLETPMAARGALEQIMRELMEDLRKRADDETDDDSGAK